MEGCSRNSKIKVLGSVVGVIGMGEIKKFDYEEVREFYQKSGFGGRVGFGEKPAIVVIDLAKAWSSKDSVIGSDLSLVIKNTKRVLDVARKKKIPIFFTTMAYDPQLKEIGSAMLKKLPHLKESLIRGTESVTIHPYLERQEDEIVIEKQRASAFFGTNFISHLINNSVDTLIITGCSTSGCIRATAESSHNYNLYTIVVREAVGDRSELAHEVNLIDIDNRYADVVELRQVVDYLENLK